MMHVKEWIFTFFFTYPSVHPILNTFSYDKNDIMNEMITWKSRNEKFNYQLPSTLHVEFHPEVEHYSDQ